MQFTVVLIDWLQSAAKKWNPPKLKTTHDDDDDDTTMMIKAISRFIIVKYLNKIYI